MIWWVGTALAWNTLGEVWPQDEPVVYHVVNAGPDAPVATGAFRDVQTAAFAGWTDALECSVLEVREGLSIPRTVAPPAQRDGLSVIRFDDEALLAPGVIAQAHVWSRANEIERFLFGRKHEPIVDADLVFSDGVTWIRDEDIALGDCPATAYSIDGAATHEIGHLLGMAHACRRSDDCVGAPLRNAAMYWSMDFCDDRFSDLSRDDVQGITALYGASVSPVCSHELDPGTRDGRAVGVAPLGVACAVRSSWPVRDALVRWDWGDGTTSEGELADHVYQTPGTYDVEVCVTEDGWPTCGGEEVCGKRRAYVRVCGEPDAKFTALADGKGGFVLRNDTPLDVPGCVSEVRWELLRDRGDTEPVISSEWSVHTGPLEAGTWTVRLAVGGMGGTGAAQAEVQSGRGCSTVPLGAGWLGWLALVTIRIRQQRQN